MYLMVQTNEKREMLTKEQSEPIIELEDIVKSTNQEDKIVDFLPIDCEDQIL